MGLSGTTIFLQVARLTNHLRAVDIVSLKVTKLATSKPHSPQVSVHQVLV